MSYTVHGSWRGKCDKIHSLPYLIFHSANVLFHFRPQKSQVSTSPGVLGLSSTSYHLIPQVYYHCLFEFVGIELYIYVLHELASALVSGQISQYHFGELICKEI